MNNDVIQEKQRKKWLVKILLLCGSYKRCAGCGCKLPGKGCYLKEKLNGFDIDGMKALLKRMKGGGVVADHKKSSRTKKATI